MTERDRAGLGKGPLRLYFRVGVGGCAQPDTAHAAVPRACSALAHLTLPLGRVCVEPRGPAAHCGCARQLCSPFPQQSCCCTSRPRTAAAAPPSRRRRPLPLPLSRPLCLPSSARASRLLLLPLPALALCAEQLSARVRPGRAVRVRLPVLVSTHRPLASGYDCCWVLRVLRGLRVLRALPVRLPLVLLVLHEIRLYILVQHRRRPRRRPRAGTGSRPAAGGGGGWGSGPGQCRSSRRRCCSGCSGCSGCRLSGGLPPPSLSPPSALARPVVCAAQMSTVSQEVQLRVRCCGRTAKGSTVGRARRCAAPCCPLVPTPDAYPAQR